jgi:hypothetical protein
LFSNVLGFDDRSDTPPVQAAEVIALARVTDDADGNLQDLLQQPGASHATVAALDDLPDARVPRTF